MGCFRIGSARKMTSDALFSALRRVLKDLSAQQRAFAVVGGVAVSVRAEVRFTRDVDLAVSVASDADAESLVSAMRGYGYVPLATVEQDAVGRLSTVRLASPGGVKVDLLFASSGIEAEAVARATRVELPDVGDVPVAEAEELLAMKVLSMTARRLQDRIDAQRLLTRNPNLDLERVRANLRLIEARGFHREQDLVGKLDSVIAEVRDA
jgi:predicted nucleotidyltransferase